MPPQLDLLGKVGSRLSGKGRIGRADAQTLGSVTGRTGGERSARVAFTPQGGDRYASVGRPGGNREPGIISGDRAAVAVIEAKRNPAHLLMLAPPVAISDKLALEIAGVEPGEAGRARSIPFAAKAMAGDTGIGSAGLATAHGDEFAAVPQPIGRAGLDCRAGRYGQRRDTDWKGAHHCSATRSRTGKFRGLLPLASFALLASCKPPPTPEQEVPQGDVRRGLAAIERSGCGSCHRIPGLRWPQGAVGPALDGIAGQGLIAGRIPNRPDTLAAFVRNAPALVPDTAMPAMPVTEAEARDIATYLIKESR